MLRRETKIARVRHRNHPETIAGTTMKKETANMVGDVHLTTMKNFEVKGSDAEAEVEEEKAAATRPKDGERRVVTHAKLWQ